MVGIWTRLYESPLAMLGLALVLFWFALALLAPILPLLDPNTALDAFKLPLSTSEGGVTYWLGTDHKGRDILARVIFGARQVLFWTVLASAVAYVPASPWASPLGT